MRSSTQPNNKKSDTTHTLLTKFRLNPESHIIPYDEEQIKRLLAKAVNENNLYAFKMFVERTPSLSGSRFLEALACHAILQNRIDMVNFLFQRELIKATTIALDNGSDAPRPLIYFAVKSGELAMVTLLVERGANIGSDDAAIQLAVKDNRIEIADYLLRRGANAHGMVSHVWGEETFLMHALRRNHNGIALSLVTHGDITTFIYQIRTYVAKRDERLVDMLKIKPDADSLEWERVCRYSPSAKHFPSFHELMEKLMRVIFPFDESAFTAFFKMSKEAMKNTMLAAIDASDPSSSWKLTHAANGELNPIYRELKLKR